MEKLQMRTNSKGLAEGIESDNLQKMGTISLQVERLKTSLFWKSMGRKNAKDLEKLGLVTEATIFPSKRTCGYNAAYVTKTFMLAIPPGEENRRDDKETGKFIEFDENKGNLYGTSSESVTA